MLIWRTFIANICKPWSSCIIASKQLLGIVYSFRQSWKWKEAPLETELILKAAPFFQFGDVDTGNIYSKPRFVIMQNPLGCAYKVRINGCYNPNVPPTSTWFLTTSLLRKNPDQYGDTKKTTKIVLPFWELTYPFTLWHFSGPMIFRRNPTVGYVSSFPWRVFRYFIIQGDTGQCHDVDVSSQRASLGKSLVIFVGERTWHGKPWEPHVFNLDFLRLTDPFVSGWTPSRLGPMGFCWGPVR